MTATATVEQVSLLDDPQYRKGVAQGHFNIICESVGLVHFNSLRIGFHAYELERQTLFGILGFGTEEECREATGTGRSTWYLTKGLARLFYGVQERLFCAMKVTNAEALADLPQSVRITEQWVRAASLDSLKEFQGKVDRELDGRAKVSDGKEGSVNLKISMPLSRKQVIEQHLQDIAEEMDEADLGRVLELILEERSQGLTLVFAIQKALESIAGLKRMEDTQKSADEALEAMQSGLSAIVDILLAALQSVQSESA
jgi:hypothetical protein